MKVKIIKARKKTYWYSDKRGEVFEVEQDKLRGDFYFYERRGKTGCLKIIDKNDCEIVKDTEKKCIIYGCTNKKNEGKFIGDICSPCYKMITEGKPENLSTNFIHKLYCESKKMNNKKGSK